MELKAWIQARREFYKFYKHFWNPRCIKRDIIPHVCVHTVEFQLYQNPSNVSDYLYFSFHFVSFGDRVFYQPIDFIVVVSVSARSFRYLPRVFTSLQVPPPHPLLHPLLHPLAPHPRKPDKAIRQNLTILLLPPPPPPLSRLKLRQQHY